VTEQTGDGWTERLAEAGQRAWEAKGEPVTALDPRWNWVDVTRIGQDPAHPEYVKGTCRHIELAPIYGIGTAERPLYRCGTCEAYLQTVLSPFTSGG
jgi:hypothetical protein